MTGPLDDRLDSWKGIAAYLDRGVRTVRRWEREESLPVHRHVHRALGSVYAYKSEIDAWRQTRKRPVADVHAYECSLQARHEGWRWREDAIDHAVRLLNNGLEIVGDHARLYASLGLAHLQYREAGIDAGEQPLRDAERCADKAFALDPASASARLLRGWLHYSHGRIQDAVRDLKAALATDGNSADALSLLSNCYLISGKVEAARPLIARLLAVDPLTPVSRCMPGWADILEGKFASAAAPYRQMFEMDPGNPMARLFYVWVLMLAQQPTAAAAVADGFSYEVRETVLARTSAFLVQPLNGDAAASHAVVTPAIESLASTTDVFPRMLAEGYALVGLQERALHWLEIAVARGFINFPFLAYHDPFVANLRTDPRFGRLMVTVKGRWDGFAV